MGYSNSLIRIIMHRHICTQSHLHLHTSLLLSGFLSVCLSVYTVPVCLDACLYECTTLSAFMTLSKCTLSVCRICTLSVCTLSVCPLSLCTLSKCTLSKCTLAKCTLFVCTLFACTLLYAPCLYAPCPYAPCQYAHLPA